MQRLDDGATRLLLRSRSSKRQPMAARLFNGLLEPGYLIMSRAMLLGIQERVERAAREEVASPPVEQPTERMVAELSPDPSLAGSLGDVLAGA